MKISVIIPAHRAEATLPRTLRSLEAAAKDLDVETVVIEDAEGRGPSWARNRGLERATGDYVFFCDADDTVKADFFREPSAALERTGADICFFRYNGYPEIPAEELTGNQRIRDRYLPAYFGYSNDDIRRWNDGGDLYLRREPGSVCRCAFRRAFIEANAIRFDESMTYFEDAAFLSHCVAFSERTVSVPSELYEYAPRDDGNLATGWKSPRHWDYKFKVLEFRKRLDAATDGQVWSYCEASCVLAALEMLKEHREGLSAYLADDRVRAALRTFPISLRHPIALAAVLYLRWRTR